jgi:hypothetical protein
MAAAGKVAVITVRAAVERWSKAAVPVLNDLS